MERPLIATAPHTPSKENLNFYFEIIINSKESVKIVHGHLCILTQIPPVVTSYIAVVQYLSPLTRD